MLRVDRERTSADLLPAINRVFELSAHKIWAIEQTWRTEDGSPVFTVAGRYRSRGWTEWTQGFQYGSSLLQFDATGERSLLELGRSRTIERMAPQLTHAGVHDHGFNNVSTYGNLWRLAHEGRIQPDPWEVRLYELALKVTGAVQARRWAPLPDGGFIYSFNGAHSLFIDTIRTLRALALAHVLGHQLIEEQDTPVNLLQRLRQHAYATARYCVYYGRGRDIFDVRGRTAHESLFNAANGTYRGPSTHQGYSPFTTWTRGLAWAMLGFAEQLEFLDTFMEDGKMGPDPIYEAACATSDFYIDAAAASDGIPYWDTGAPGLSALADWGDRAADPFNDHEPVDSSAAAIAAQGLLRLARVVNARGGDGRRYEQAGLRVLATLIDDSGPYLSVDPSHQGLLLHSIYHRPNGWDHVPDGSRIPRGESGMWGDYHLREVALFVKRLAEGGPYLAFFGAQPVRAEPISASDRGQ
jgi:unsaturated chondroitin disaccharide hydrolase